MGESSAHWGYYFATGGLPSVPGSAHSDCYSATEHQGKVRAARIRGVILWRDAKGNEGSAHSGCCFCTGYLAIGESSAHSGCCGSACNRGIGEGSAISRRYGYTDDEGSAHSGGTSYVGRQGWVRAAHMQSVPSRVCGTMRDIKRRRDHAVKIMRL